MKQPISRFVALVLFLGATTLACALPSLPSNPQPPLPSLTPSTADADAFEKNFKDAAAEAKNGVFTITITQEQLSSWLVLRAPDLAKTQGYEWPLKNTQAALADGKITLYGIISQKNIPETPAQIVVTPSVDTAGQLVIKIESGQLGIVGVPADLTKNLSKTIQDALTSQLSQIKATYKLTTLVVKDGKLTLTGQISK